MSEPTTDRPQEWLALQRARLKYEEAQKAYEGETEIDSAPPSAPDLEKRILSSCIQEPAESLSLALEQGLRAEHFYVVAHRHLFQILCERTEKGSPVDMFSLSDHLRDIGAMENMGGVDYITDLCTCEHTHTSLAAYVKIVMDKARLRAVISTCAETMVEARQSPAEVAAFLDEYENKVLGLTETTERTDLTPEKDLEELSVELEEYASGTRKEFPGLTTGYWKLDHLTQGLKPGELYIIAARPSMGKTSLMMNIIEHISLEKGLRSLVFSCEMPRKALNKRTLFSRAGVPLARVKPGFKLTKEEVRNFHGATASLLSGNILIDDTSAISITELRARARRLVRKQKVSVIAVDYLQLMRSTSPQARGNREREIADISAGLKALSKELSVPVICLAQLNRDAEKRNGKPRMSDLRESGAIEQDADVIALLYRDSYYNKDEDETEMLNDEAELIIAKNRNGATDTVYLTFDKPLMKFSPRKNEE